MNRVAERVLTNRVLGKLLRGILVFHITGLLLDRGVANDCRLHPRVMLA